MKENLKVNILWLLLLLAGYGLISVLVSAGVLNLFYIQILEQIGINIILAVGLNLIVGFSGQFSLGHAGFMAIGAYAAAIIVFCTMSCRRTIKTSETVKINN